MPFVASCISKFWPLARAYLGEKMSGPIFRKFHPSIGRAQNSVSTMRGSLLAQGACSLWPAAFYPQICVSSDSCKILTCVSTAQARTKRLSVFSAQFGLRHFKKRCSCDGSCDMRRLAQGVCPRSGPNLDRNIFR